MLGTVTKVILLILTVTSIIGWLIFVAGFGIFYRILSPRDAPLPATIGVNWTLVLSPMFLFGVSAIPLYIVVTLRIFLRNERQQKICSAIIMFLNFLYMSGLVATIFILSLLLAGGLGDYLKNIFMITETHILVMVIGCLTSVLPYWAHLVIWPLSQIRRKFDPYRYQELVQN